MPSLDPAATALRMINAGLREIGSMGGHGPWCDGWRSGHFGPIAQRMRDVGRRSPLAFVASTIRQPGVSPGDPVLRSGGGAYSSTSIGSSAASCSGASAVSQVPRSLLKEDGYRRASAWSCRPASRDRGDLVRCCILAASSSDGRYLPPRPDHAHWPRRSAHRRNGGRSGARVDGGR